MFKQFDLGKYMTAEVAEVKPKTVVLKIANKKSGNLLGWVEWYGPWRQYCFVRDDLVFSRGCFQELANFLGRQNQMQRTLRKKPVSVSSQEYGDDKK
jgi:hypothetical protein